MPYLHGIDQESNFRISDLCDLMETYLEPAQVKRIYHAYLFGAEAHEGQRRATGEAYIFHPLAVARILAELHMDEATLSAALLHDVIEDTKVAKEEVNNKFGKEVAELVDGVSKLKHIEFANKTEAQAANFFKMVMAMTRDIRIILLKLADRLHNMRTLGAKNIESRRRIARETLELYAPIADRLGMGKICQELQELGFAALYPRRYEVLTHRIRKTKNKRKKMLSTIKKSIERRFSQDNIEAKVRLSKKLSYPIYCQMREQPTPSFKNFKNTYIFRITVNSADACYRALGALHSLYKPIQGGFQDHIAIPKSNGYQSLHTNLFYPKGMSIEARISTEDMSAFSQLGIATRGLHKSDEGTAAPRQRTDHWLRELLDIQKTAGNPVEFLDNFKIDLFPNEVYVFSPKGAIIELPRGATAIDYAYAVHSDIGNSAIKAKADGQLIPLHTILETGQTVEVITANWARPHLDWLSFAITAKARSSIRAYQKNLKRKDAVLLGRRMMDQELDRYKLSVNKLNEAQRNALLSTFKCSSLDDLLENIGLGNRMAFLVVQQLILSRKKGKEAVQKLEERPSKPLVIKGTENMAVTLAKCCRPIPGDHIKGYVSTGKGIVIHTHNCKNMAEKRIKTENWLDVVWEDNLKGEFPVDIRMDVANRRGVLATLAAAISNLGVNIETVSSEEKEGIYARLKFCVWVRNRTHKAMLIRHLRRIKIVERIYI